MNPNRRILIGKKTKIEIEHYGQELGLLLMGGTKTGLGRFLIQEVSPNSAADKDGRLRTGDQIKKINGISLEGFTYDLAIRLLKMSQDKTSFIVYRDINNPNPHPDPELVIFDVDITKGKNGFGLITVSEKAKPGIKIHEIMGSIAANNKIKNLDESLVAGDEILAVNGIGLFNRNSNEAVRILQACKGKVTLKVGRRFISEDEENKKLATSRINIASSNEFETLTFLYSYALIQKNYFHDHKITLFIFN